MSSQGPVGNPAITKGPPPFNNGHTGGSPALSSNYTFTTASIRDGSDWIAYKKQALIYREDKSKINQDPWFSRGNDYRLQYLLGKYKVNGNAPSCTGCASNSFGINGPY